MKKFGLLLASALALTVGGVYATFTYASASVEQISSELDKTIAGKTTDTKKGEIKFVSVSQLFVDEDAQKNLKTSYAWQGATVVNFTADKAASPDVRNSGIKLSMSVSFSGFGPNFSNYVYDDGTGEKPIFNIKDNDLFQAVKLNSGNPILGDYTIDLDQYLGVNEFSLPTPADHDAFVAKFNTVKITLTVFETPEQQ